MNSLKKNLLLLGLAAVCLPSNTVNAFDYNISSAGSLVLTDNSTGISEIITMFKNDVTLVSVDGVAWDYTGFEGGESLVTYTTIANGVVQDEGAIDISDTTRELPTSFDVGSVQVGKSKSSSLRLSRIVLSTIFDSISTASNLVFYSLVALLYFFHQVARLLLKSSCPLTATPSPPTGNIKSTPPASLSSP